MTLSDLIFRLRWLLGNADGDLFADEMLTENLRLGLAELQKMCPVLLQVAGLDGAETTVLEDMEDLLIRQARVLVLWQRWQQRGETYHPDPLESADLEKMLRTERQALQAAFDQHRRSYLQGSATVPYAVWPEENLD